MIEAVSMVHKWDPTQAFDRIVIEVYGESGVGKTVFASTWPSPIIIDVDGGMASIQSEIDFIPVFKEPNPIKAWEMIQRAWGNLAYKEHPYQTVVLDSLNTMQRMVLDGTVANWQGVKRSYDDVPSQGDYQKALLDFDKMVAAFCKLPINVVLIAQSGEVRFEGDNVRPSFIGKATADKIAAKCDVIGYMYRHQFTKNGDTKVLPVISFNELQHVSKDRTWRLPPRISSPTYEKLAEHWRKS